MRPEAQEIALEDHAERQRGGCGLDHVTRHRQPALVEGALNVVEGQRTRWGSDPSLVGELLPADVLARRKRMRAAGENADRVLEQRLVGELGIGRKRRQPREEQIELACLEHFNEPVLVGLADQNERFGVRVQQPRQCRWQDSHPPAASPGADAQRPARAAGDDIDVFSCETKLTEDRAGASDEAFPVRGRCNPPGRALEQRHPEGLLELGNGGRDRRLGQVEQPSGLAETSLLGDSEQHAQPPQFQLSWKPAP